MKKIGIACDHAGYEMKEFLVGYLGAQGFEVLDFGTHSPESVDYPDYAHQLGEAIDRGELDRGIGLCGSGEGMAMTLNKHQAVRAGLAWQQEIAELNARLELLNGKPPRCDEAYAAMNTAVAESEKAVEQYLSTPI